MNIFQRAIRKTKHIYHLLFPPDRKGEAEMEYWRRTYQAQAGKLHNHHYERFYTAHFGLTNDFYDKKRILDIGCGPRGSLEWANNSAERVGLDPLANLYIEELGANQHKMQYVRANSEHIPYSNQHFDVVCSFNSLDHVNDLGKTIAEIDRVLKKGGLFLLISDLHHHPTICEPISFGFEVVQQFPAHFAVLEERHFEKKVWGMYESVEANEPYDHSDKTERYGILTAKFQKQ